MEPTRVIEISGTPAERGYQHGIALAPAIGRFYERWMSEAGAKKDVLEERDVLSFAWSHLPETRAYAPDLVEEVEGIASGADIPFAKVWFLNCFDEVGNYHLYRDRNALGHACTTFAATGRSTVGGVTYVGQNWDISAWYDSVILDVKPGSGEIGALVYTHPGIVGGSGINNAGVSLIWNSLHANDCRTGVPCTVLVRKALQQSKLSDALGAVVRGVRAIGFNFILGNDFGAVNVEATATQHRFHYISTHYAHANHYQETDQLRFEGKPTETALSFVKGSRLQQRLDEAAGQIDLDLCKDVLRDHANFPGSVCIHEDPPAGRHDGHTQAALLYVPAERRMLATNGPPCENPYEEYRAGREIGAPASPEGLQFVR
jgi:isopenicillin-N N-acyltransferase like protein